MLALCASFRSTIAEWLVRFSRFFWKYAVLSEVARRRVNATGLMPADDHGKQEISWCIYVYTRYTYIHVCPHPPRIRQGSCHFFGLYISAFIAGIENVM